MLLTNTLVSKLCKAFANDSTANIKLSKTQLHQIGQSGGFLGRLVEPLLKNGLSLIGNVLKLLAKNVLIPLWLTAAVSATDVALHKKMFGSGRPSDVDSHTTTLKILNQEMSNNIEIVKSFEKSGLSIKGVSQKFKNESKEQKRSFIRMLSSILGE